MLVFQSSCNVGCLIRLFRLSQNDFICCSSKTVLKSPKSIILSYVEECKSKVLLAVSRRLLIKFYESYVYEEFINHLFLRKFNST